MMKTSTIAFLLSAVLICATGCGSRRSKPTAAPRLRYVDCQQLAPLAFLSELKKDPSETVVPQNVPTNWMSRSDVAELIKLIHSEEAASSVMMPISSWCDPPSTVGREAMFLIEGHRKGKYPPELESKMTFRPNPEEIQAWWKKEKP